MKTLKTLLVTKGLFIAAMSMSGLSTPVVAHASEAQGLTCPTGTEATLVSGVLRCKKPQPKVLASICSPIAFSRLGMRVVPNVVMQPSGSDTCLAVGTGQTLPSEMQPPTPGLDPAVSAFHRVINATGPDTFAADVYVFPDNTPGTFGHDASRGIACESGFNGTSVSNGRGLRCDATVVKTATCDQPYLAERHTGRDLCVYTQDLGLATVRVVGDYTVPTGYSGIGGDPAQHGWTLDQDRNGNIDAWTQHTFAYAQPR